MNGRPSLPRGASLSGANFWTGVRFLGYTPVCLGPADGRCPLRLLSWPFFCWAGARRFLAACLLGERPLACLDEWMDSSQPWRPLSAPRFRSEARRVFSVAPRAPPAFFLAITRFFRQLPVPSFGRIVASCPLRRLSCPLRSRVYVLDRVPFFRTGAFFV